MVILVYMKKYIVTFLSLFCLGFGICQIPIVKDTLFPRPVIHVFLEAYATNPALSQMIEFAKLPKDTKKIISWHRFPNRKNELDLNTYNTREVDLPAKEGHYSNGTRQMLNAVMEEAEQNPQAVFEIHGNLNHIPIVIKPFLENLPAEKIKRIHLYEDGYGVFYKGYDNYQIQDNQTDTLLNELRIFLSEGKGTWIPPYELLFYKLYPTTYHLFEPDFLYKNEKYANIISHLKYADIQEINFHKLRKTLSNEQKDVIYRLSGFDYPKYNKLMRGKRTFMFVLGYHFDDKDRMQAEENLLKSLYDGSSQYLKHPQRFTWFYKPHPSYSATTGLGQIRTAFSDIIEIPAQIPFEVFILAGLKPTLTAGFSSSLFYSLYSQDVLIYVRRPGDKYQPFLTDTGKLKPEQIMTYKKFLAK